MRRITAEDLWTLAQTMWGEARGEGTDGLGAVALVIRNRSQDRRWERLSIAGICRQPWQFSVWNVGDPNRAKLLEVAEKLRETVKKRHPAAYDAHMKQ